MNNVYHTLKKRRRQWLQAAKEAAVGLLIALVILAGFYFLPILAGGR